MFATAGGAGYPFFGLLVVQMKRCGIVPGSWLHNWQFVSVRPHFVTLHFRTCGHWPPLMADPSDDAHTGSHSAAAFFPGPLPLVIALMMLGKSTTCIGCPLAFGLRVCGAISGKS